ncbi:STAS domain-containing protein [Rhodococcus sp. G-MC3]|uniref:STAS domain-containing protein n=1 Tax=Rhodococcus sp. G-MC3 TaxID=3046209 RepID=UPI0024BAB376|nr:STAS domain-containing protein [Rhodococcus sp. G-MC3]MDJ0396720.1 STAS domain-containing protein [Rhodococcus sp. G-MC3]
MRLDVTVEHIDQVAVVIACGEVDIMTAAVLGDGIEAALSMSPAAVIVDLSEVGFLASVGMSVLISARRRARSNVAVIVVADGPHTRRPMELVGLSAATPPAL